MSESNPVALRRRVGAEHPARIGLDNLENTDAERVPERVRTSGIDESILKICSSGRGAQPMPNKRWDVARVGVSGLSWWRISRNKDAGAGT